MQEQDSGLGGEGTFEQEDNSGRTQAVHMNWSRIVV